MENDAKNTKKSLLSYSEYIRLELDAVTFHYSSLVLFLSRPEQIYKSALSMLIARPLVAIFLNPILSLITRRGIIILSIFSIDYIFGKFIGEVIGLGNIGTWVYLLIFYILGYCISKTRDTFWYLFYLIYDLTDIMSKGYATKSIFSYPVMLEKGCIEFCDGKNEKVVSFFWRLFNGRLDVYNHFCDNNSFDNDTNIVYENILEIINQPCTYEREIELKKALDCYWEHALKLSSTITPAMQELRFWDIIGKNGDINTSLSDLKYTLASLSNDELIGFEKQINAQYIKAYQTWDFFRIPVLLEGVNLYINGQSLIYLLIYHGKEIYENILSNPDLIADYIDDLNSMYEFFRVNNAEGQVCSISKMVYEEKYGKMPKLPLGKSSFDIPGEQWSDQLDRHVELQRSYPNTFKKVQNYQDCVNDEDQ
jgi:hypothetical protein